VAQGSVRAYVGMGGNSGGEGAVSARFGDSAARMASLEGVVVVRRASRYRTAPVGPVREQPPFLNSAALVVLRGWRPLDFLRELLAIEAALGRDRSRETAQGPRPLDLDLLLWDDLVADEAGPPRLELPHPRLARRAFALAPLAELGGEDLVVPGPGGGRVGDLLALALADPTQRIEKLADA
jgi:2-amino-4-hydroxy-6-hydroxymethyldihydropteridine diphosphokinase